MSIDLTLLQALPEIAPAPTELRPKTCKVTSCVTGSTTCKVTLTT